MHIIILYSLLILLLLFNAGLFLDYLHTRSAAKLSLILEDINEDMLFSEVKERLELNLHNSFTTKKEVEFWGTVKDKEILNNCNLHRFIYWGLPHKFILVYEDKQTDRVRLVTILGM